MPVGYDRGMTTQDSPPPAGRGGRERGGPAHRGEVLRVEQLTPHLVRVVLGGDGLAGFGTRGQTDHYVKLLSPAPGEKRVAWSCATTDSSMT